MPSVPLPVPTLAIAAASRRQAMDWSLVLASQDISAWIVQRDEGWRLEVEPEEYSAAVDAIRQYQLENRGWEWRRRIPWVETTFHWGSLGWCLLLILAHWITTQTALDLRTLGQLSNLARQGEPWRIFTAMFLHADLGHLMANVTIGFVLLGVAMGRYGAGVGLLAAYLAGALGNVAGLCLYPKPYLGLGASGMVMGALGLVSVPLLPLKLWRTRTSRYLIRAVVAGVFLFLLLGVNPASDVIAHVGGFIAGVGFGGILSLLPRRFLVRRDVIALSWISLAGLCVGPFWLALHPALKQ
ncbi:MAG: rhomboid family intramembrane serine protease [Verrucomicrobiota bacterium]